MNVAIQYDPAYSLATVTLTANERIKSESGAMVCHSAGFQVETSSDGGFMKGLKRAALGGESFFVNTWVAPAQGGSISFAPPYVGDMVHANIEGDTLFLQSGAFVASSPALEVDTKFGGAKSFFSGEGLFLLKISGTGDLIFSSVGAIHTVELAAGEVMTVDTSHMVGFSGGVTYTVRKVGNWKSTLLGGEGLVCDFSGPGILWIQTRSPQGMAGWIQSLIPGGQQ